MSIAHDMELAAGFRVPVERLEALFRREVADDEDSWTGEWWSCRELGIAPTEDFLDFADSLGRRLRCEVVLELGCYGGDGRAVFQPLGLRRMADGVEDFPVTVSGSLSLASVLGAAATGRFDRLGDRLRALGLRPGRPLVTITHSVT